MNDRDELTCGKEKLFHSVLSFPSSDSSNSDVDDAKVQAVDYEMLNEMLLDVVGNVKLDVFLTIFLARHDEDALLIGERLSSLYNSSPFETKDEASSACGKIFVCSLWDYILKTNYWVGKEPSKYIKERTANFVESMRDYVIAPIGTIEVFTEFTKWVQMFGLNGIETTNWHDLCPMLRILATDNATIKNADIKARKFYMQTTMRALPVGTIMLPYYKIQNLKKRMLPQSVSSISFENSCLL